MPVVSADEVRDSPSVSRRHQLRFGSGEATGATITGAAWTGAGSGMAIGSGAASPLSSSGAIGESSTGASGGTSAGTDGAGVAGSGSLPNNLEKKPRFFGSFSLIILPVALPQNSSCLHRTVAFASAMP